MRRWKSKEVINVDDYSPDKQGQAEVKVERPDTPPPFLVVATAHANTPTRTDSPTVLGRSPMIGLDESSDHEIDNIETIHLDESNENEEIEERFRSNISSNPCNPFKHVLRCALFSPSFLCENKLNTT